MVPLFSRSLVQVLLGDTAEFSYLIALVDPSLDVTTNVSITPIGPFNGLLENLQLVDQGEDVYTFTIPSVTLSMDQTVFALQFAGNTIETSEVTLRVLGTYIIQNIISNFVYSYVCMYFVTSFSAPANLYTYIRTYMAKYLYKIELLNFEY